MNVEKALQQIARFGSVGITEVTTRTAIALLHRGLEQYQTANGNIVLAFPAKGRYEAGWKRVGQ